MIFAYICGVILTTINVVLAFNAVEFKGMRNCIPQLIIQLIINFAIWGFIAYVDQFNLM